MNSIFKHAVLGFVIGLGLAGGAWIAWWAVSLGVDSGGVQLHTLWPALGIAAFPGGVVGALTSWLHQRRRLPPEPAKPTPPTVTMPPKKKKRRRPLAKDALRGRITPNLRWQAMSPGLTRLLHGEQLGKPIYPLLHPEDVPALDKAFTQAQNERSIQLVVCRFVIGAQAAPSKKAAGKNSLRSDTKLLPALSPGSFVTLRCEILAKRDRAGRIKRFACRFIDLTPIVLHKELELQLARKLVSRAKRRLRHLGQDLDRLKLSYRELYQNAPVMYFSLDQRGKFVTFNDTFLVTLGYQRRDLHNRDYTAILAPAALKRYLASADSMPAETGERETQWRKKDGALFDVWLHTVPVHDEEGNFVRFRNAALDLSEKNRLANELRARGDELERTNQRLRAINGELEAFTHVVSHDLKEPLRTLQAYSSLLAEEHAAQLGPDGFQYVNHLLRASRRLATLIDELLNLGQAGRITREPKAFNMIEIVATVRQDLLDMIQRKEAHILTEGSLPDVVGDPVRITQLLTNLVANGLKYNQNPAPQVVVGAMNANDPARVTIFVRDNGIGIDPAFHQQIFDIFRRLHQSDQYEGTGAGLAICKKIVEGHGGRIWVESQPGAGATFFFTLPRSPFAKAGVKAADKKPVEPAPAEQPSSRQRKAILSLAAGMIQAPRLVVVDDQADVGMIIEKLGKRDGMAITWFPTAEDAWTHLQKHGADLLLFDVHLPGMNGVELCRRIRSLPHLQDTPVAMFTPDHEEEKLAELRAAGADFFLTKDLLAEPTAWQQKIRTLLEQIRQPASQ